MPAASSSGPHAGTNRFNTPFAKTRKNFIPAASWLKYNWIDKDPEMDFVAFAIEQSGMTAEEIEELTERAGHKVSRFTIYNWLYGDVRRPQNWTIATVMSVLGYERQWKHGNA